MKSWKEVKLSEIIDLKYGKSLPQGERKLGNVSVYGSNGIIGNHDKYLIDFPTVVIGRKGSVGKVHYVDNPSWIIDTAFYIEIKNKKVELRYLYLALKIISEKQIIPKGVKPGINKSQYLDNKISIPYLNNEPDIEMQRDIADKLDKIFLETNEAIEQIRVVQENSNKILESELQNVFGNKVGNLTEIALENICDTTSGGTPNRSDKTYYNNGEIPWLKSGELNDNEDIIKSEEFISDEGLKKSNAKIFSKGTILLAMYGATAGKLGILGINASTNQAVCAIKPKKGVNNKYIFWFLKFHRNILIKKAFGGAQPNINQGMIKKIPILIPFNDNKPDIKRQKEISKKLDLIQKQIVGLHQKYQEQKRSLILFKQSILQQAFVGELVKVKEPKISLFPIQQAIASILQRGFRRGEMVIAKVLYIGQEIYNVPLNINFSPQNFGPYDSTVKKAITAGASKYNNFFARQPYGKGCVYSLGSDANKILKYSNSQVNMKMQYFLNEMMPVIGKADSPSIERLATVCKIIQDSNTTDDVLVNNRMQEWKPGKFKKEEVNKSLNFIKSKGWDKILIK